MRTNSLPTQTGSYGTKAPVGERLYKGNSRYAVGNLKSVKGHSKDQEHDNHQECSHPNIITGQHGEDVHHVRSGLDCKEIVFVDHYRIAPSDVGVKYVEVLETFSSYTDSREAEIGCTGMDVSHNTREELVENTAVFWRVVNFTSAYS